MKTIFLVILFTGVISRAARPGNDGGGGMGVLCNNQGVLAVESLDLYEAKNVWGYSIPKEDFKTAARRVGSRYWISLNEQPDEEPLRNEDGYAKQTEQFFNDYFVRKMKFIPKGSRLRSTDDATLILDPPPSCKIVQVIVYVDEGPDVGTILVDKEYWDLLDAQNKLAFYFHENMYKAYRDFRNERNSDAIRKWAAALFSTVPFPSRNGEVRKAKTALRCQTESQPHQGSPYETNARFFVTPIENSNEYYAQTKLYFQYLGNFGRMRAPVEHKAISSVVYNSFLGIKSHPDDLRGNTTVLKINSIVGGLELAIIEERKCIGTTGCVDLYLAQRFDDGRVLKEKISCKEIKVIQE